MSLDFRRRASLAFLVLALHAVAAAVLSAQTPEDRGRLARELYDMGYLMTMLGEYEQAVRLFEKSLETRPTAEAYTYLGWTYSHMGDYRRAKEEAEKAIRLDPDFGNPYNDIGVYLIEQGKEEEAIPYLERAMRAKRYCCYQFPHYNMGRIHLKKKNYDKAREEFEKALAIDPDYVPARDALKILEEAGISEL